MTHLVLARKYRPRSFGQVLGQDSIVATLRAVIEKERIAHAMLFTGGRGIGKTTIARIVAKALVCMDRKGADPCGSCPECRSVDDFSSLDVIEIDGASHTGVDDVRELRDSARYQPSSARYKIFIIDEVHMLSISAFNALLKILEEPPAHVIFIFATTEAHKIPKTILSRCQRYDFKRVDQKTISSALKLTLEAEGYAIDDAAIRLIASLADGSLRDSLSMAEQIMSSGRASPTAEEVANLLGVASHLAVKDLAEALIDGEIYQALSIIKDVYESGLDICHLMDATAERFRVLSLCGHVNKERALKLLPMLEAEDFDQSAKRDSADLKRLFAMALDALAEVSQSKKPLLAMELFALRAAKRPAIGDAVSIGHCLQRLDAIMRNRPLPAEPAKPIGLGDKGQAASGVVASARVEPVADVLSSFREALDALGDDEQMLASILRHARPELDHEARSLTLNFDLSFHCDQAKARKDSPSLRRAIGERFGEGLRLFFKHQGPEQASAMSPREADEREEREEHAMLEKRAHESPLVKKALEIFGGDITEVKRVAPG